MQHVDFFLQLLPAVDILSVQKSLFYKIHVYNLLLQLKIKIKKEKDPIKI